MWLVNPIGFVIVLLIFLFAPFVVASTSSPDVRLKRIFDISFTGRDIVEEDAFSVGVHVLMVALLVALVVSAGTALIPGPQKRSFAAAVAGTVSGGLLVAAALWTSHSLDAGRNEYLSDLSSAMPPNERAKLFDQIGSEVEVGLGFWLGLTGLGVITAFNVYLILHSRRRPAEAVR